MWLALAGGLNSSYPVLSKLFVSHSVLFGLNGGLTLTSTAPVISEEPWESAAHNSFSANSTMR